MSVTIGTYGATDDIGWSVITPNGSVFEGGTINALWPGYPLNTLTTADTKKIYVSSSYDLGSGASDGTQVRPYTTIAAAKLQMRAGCADWMLLKRGDTFHEWLSAPTTGGVSWGQVAGAGVLATANPWVLTSYGTGVRPIMDGPSTDPVTTTLNCIGASTADPARCCAIIGIHVYVRQRDPDSSFWAGITDAKRIGYMAQNTKGIFMGGLSDFLLIEDCHIEFASDCISIAGTLGNNRTYVRRCQIGPSYYTKNGAEVDLTGSTNIGNLTSGGGLAAIFNGTRLSAIASCGSKASTTSAWAGKTFATPSVIQNVYVFGSSDQGYVNIVATPQPTVTLQLYGKTGTAPASETDGTLLGTASFTDANQTSGNFKTITANDHTTAFNHVWIRLSHGAAASTVSIGEIIFHWSAPDQSIGCYIQNMRGPAYVEENTFDWGGWYIPAYEYSSSFGYPHSENHNAYLTYGGGSTFSPTIRGNIAMRGSNNALCRDGAGSFVYDNLITHACSAGYSGGVNQTDKGPWVWDSNVIIHMIREGQYKEYFNDDPNMGPAPIAAGVGPQINGFDNSSVTNNLILHSMLNGWGITNTSSAYSNTPSTAIRFGNDLGVLNGVCIGNIIYNYRCNANNVVVLQKGSDDNVQSTLSAASLPITTANKVDLTGVNSFGWSAPNRTLVTFDQDELGGAGTLDHFADTVMANNKGTNMGQAQTIWDDALTATKINDYFRAGFDLVGAPSVSVPTVTTGAVSNLTFQSVTLSGTVTDSGGAAITERGFAYGVSSNPTISGTHATVAGTTGGYNYALSSLAESTTYHVRAYATNSEGTAYGIDVQFDTPASPQTPPTVTQATPITVAKYRAELSGNVTSAGTQSVTERGFVVNGVGAPTTSDTKYTVTGTTGAYTYSAEPLTAGHTYFVRAFATSSAGTSYSNEVSFTTKSTYKTSLRLRIRS